MMFMPWRVLALAGALSIAFLPNAVRAQLAPSGSVNANATASAGPMKAVTPSTWLDRWCSSTQYTFAMRGASSWSCISGQNLSALAGLTSGADKLAYFTGAGTADVTTLSSYIRTLLDDTDALTARATLGAVIGTDVQGYDADLAALASNSTDGLWAHTGSGTGAARTLTAPAAGFTISNPAGIAGNPTFVLANDLAALEGLGSTGIARRTGSDAWSVGTTVAINEGGTGQTAAAAARGSSGLNVEAYTGHGNSDYSIAATDKVVGTTATFTSPWTWTLPAANGVNAGQPLIVSDFFGGVDGTNTLIIQRAGSDTINGGTSVTISSANGAYALWSDGSSKWTAQGLGGVGTAGVSTIGGLSGTVGVANGLEASGSNIQITAARRTQPTTQTFSTGTNATYTTPANVLSIEVLVVGAGGAAGGVGGSGSPTNGTAGTASCWNATGGTACGTPLYSAGGGAASNANTATATAGGSITGSATPYFSMAGGAGGGGDAVSTNRPGGAGGSSCFGGTAAGQPGANGNNAVNWGAGGSGGGIGASGTATAGGAGGGCLRFIINSPSGSYLYSVGAGGTGGNAGTGGGAGGNGAGGYITVIERYNFLLKRDLDPANDNTPMFLDAAA